MVLGQDPNRLGLNAYWLAASMRTGDTRTHYDLLVLAPGSEISNSLRPPKCTGKHLLCIIPLHLARASRTHEHPAVHLSCTRYMV